VIWGVGWGWGGEFLTRDARGMHRGMPKVNLKTHFKKIMLTLSLICYVYSVGMSDFRLVVSIYKLVCY
jgi:hypothetical protein